MALPVYYFPRAAIINYHKLGGLKEQKCILLQFWRLEIWNQIWNQMVSCVMLPYEDSREEESFFPSS